MRTALRAMVVGIALMLFGAVGPAGAQAALLQVSSDPFTNAGSQHATEVEPDIAGAGTTLVAAFQTGRFTDGGSSDIGFATSTNSGATWTKGFLPGVTVFKGGSHARVSDPAVAYDARHKVWLIVSLPINSSVGVPGVIVSRSVNGGASWGNPVTVATAADQGFDKTWITCDDTATSPYYGHCYATWDDAGAGLILETSTSSDGGLHWGPALPTSGAGTGIGGQPLVQPNGTVIVPAASSSGSGIVAYRSTNGGASWSALAAGPSAPSHTVAGSLRTSVLPSAAEDHSGKVYVAWQDCRFRSGCSANDIVLATTTDGVHWSSVVRVPIDPVTSSADHFIPGIAVDPSTSGSTAHVAISYYELPSANCTVTTCSLEVGVVSSTNGGATWSAPRLLTGTMRVTWLANTNQGYMVGDYMATAFAGGTPHPLFMDALAPSGGKFRESAYTYGGLVASAGAVPASSSGALPVAATDHGAALGPLTLR